MEVALDKQARDVQFPPGIFVRVTGSVSGLTLGVTLSLLPPSLPLPVHVPEPLLSVKPFVYLTSGLRRGASCYRGDSGKRGAAHPCCDRKPGSSLPLALREGPGPH